ncbi:hypothetical protein C2S52_008346 [Perilla frutescens var. hirtella]|nr:hypothetical protein C2S52_008346 [Perilla frutescens var. hirtella]
MYGIQSIYLYVSSIDSSDCVVEFSPGGTTKCYIPQCDPSLKPFVNQKFNTLDIGIQFYKKYAIACGFDIRLSSTRKSYDGECLMWRYVVCNKEGVKHAINDDPSNTANKRRTVSNRFECKARIVFKFAGSEGYVVTKFIEKHTHTLVPEAYRYFMKMNSKMDVGHQKFVMDYAKANIGAMPSYKMLKTVAGSYSSVGCSRVQVKKFSRDLKAYVIGADAQMVIDKLHRKRELCTAFVFEYEVDQQDQLKSLFWADPISRRNYCAFGDVVSFDATYGTNKYNMIFAPFTGKDNHGKCVTLGAALMTGESIESYAWVFQQFKKCMVHEPSILMTDQDPAIKVAFERVFQHTRHRLCMWHIMSKITEKVPAVLKKDPLFMKQFCSLVWSVHVEPDVFERRWHDIMDEFELSNEAWFISMYNIRETWIPACFRDLKMGGLFRTTSPSESENSFFRMYMSKHSNLLEFFMYFDNALDSQRHCQAKLNHEDLSCCPNFRTLLQFERYAATVYTKSIFYELQDDFEHACYNCHLTNITQDEVSCQYQVSDRSHEVFTVYYDKVKKNVECSCKKFVMDNRFMSYDIVSEFYSCLSMVEGDLDRSHALLQAIRDIKDVFKSKGCDESIEHVKKRLFEEYYQSSIPGEVTIKPPDLVKMKGSGSRIKSNREKAIEVKKKPLRTCSVCGEKCNHDARNCPNKQ